jgi:hypothetical protein
MVKIIFAVLAPGTTYFRRAAPRIARRALSIGDRFYIRRVAHRFAIHSRITSPRRASSAFPADGGHHHTLRFFQPLFSAVAVSGAAR